MAFKPVITISRECGSGGRIIAKKVAGKLSFRFYDKNLIELIAKQSKRRKAIIKKLDEKQRLFLDDFIASLLDPEYITYQTYIKSLSEVIFALGQKGSTVILGRGGNFIIPRKKALHVRVIAPFLKRVGYTVESEKIPKAKAKALVRRIDRNRKEFIQQHFGKNPSNANYYDLVVNTEKVTINEAVEIVIKAYKEKFSS